MTYEQRQQYIAQVIELQNHPALLSQDHVTICGFFTSRDQFERHIADLKHRITR